MFRECWNHKTGMFYTVLQALLNSSLHRKQSTTLKMASGFVGYFATFPVNNERTKNHHHHHQQSTKSNQKYSEQKQTNKNQIAVHFCNREGGIRAFPAQSWWDVESRSLVKSLWAFWIICPAVLLLVRHLSDTQCFESSPKEAQRDGRCSFLWASRTLPALGMDKGTGEAGSLQMGESTWGSLRRASVLFLKIVTIQIKTAGK